jgi:hydroxymethylbilane synthase
MEPLRIGTRGSPLALAQASEARARLMAATGLAETAFPLVVIRVTGDAVQDRPLGQLGGKGLFTKEIEEALLAGDVDLAVHSMKDVPTAQPEGLVLDGHLPRADPRDAVVALGGARGIAALPEGAVVGTSSLRRRAQLLARRPDLRVVEFRGNVQTRLAKLAQGVAEATLLAMAGLNRLGLTAVPAAPIAPEEMLPALGQGAIGLERRLGDRRVAEIVALVDDRATGLRLAAERGFLAALDGSCQTPIAGLAELDGDRLRLAGEILRPDGRRVLSAAIEGPAEEGERIGRELAGRLLAEAGPGFFA